MVCFQFARTDRGDSRVLRFAPGCNVAHARTGRFRLFRARLSDEGTVMQETRRILLDGAVVEVVRQGDELVAQDGRRVKAAQAVHLPPVEPSKILCAHLNYRNRLQELKAVCPPAPNYFAKPPSCLLGHGGAVIRPKGCKFLNYEGEVAIVIGRTARNIRMADA